MMHLKHILTFLLSMNVFACSTDFPASPNGSSLPSRTGDPHFGDIALCATTSAQTPTTCPGEACAQNVMAEIEPDQQSVVLDQCTLEFIFNRGTVVSSPAGQDDLVIHLGSATSISASARVEASFDGLSGSYKVLGFINPPATLPVDSRCIAKCAEKKCTTGEICGDGSNCSSEGYCIVSRCGPNSLAIFDLAAGAQSSGCNEISNLHHLKLSHFDGSGTISVDAIEALPKSYRLATE